MAITEEQKAERVKYIGSSDIAALFTDTEGKSLDPFKTAKDVWITKFYELENKERDETKPQSRGHRYESALIEFAESELGCKIETNPVKLRFICESHPIFACNLDGYTLISPASIVEAKTTGLTGEWGEPGTDDVPFRVNLQVQHQMLCTGLERAYIAVLLGRWGLTEEIYVVDRNESIINAIIERGEQFWNDYVITGTPPPDSETGNIQLLKRIHRQPEKYADVPLYDVINWESAKEVRLLMEKQEKELFAKVIEALGDAEGARLTDGRTFTYLSQSGADIIDRKKLKNEYPEVYEKVASENKYRVARIVTPKG